jgi:hypothetical protein
MARSIFALCPRGYGKSSFRIMEAIHFGAIPVYISDEFVTPYHSPFNSFCIQVGVDYNLFDLLRDVRADHIPILQKGVEEVKPLFTYDGCKRMIIAEVNK